MTVKRSSREQITRADAPATFVAEPEVGAMTSVKRSSSAHLALAGLTLSPVAEPEVAP